MVYEIPSRHEEFTLMITVVTPKPEKIIIVVKDADKKQTVFTDRFKTVNGEVSFFVRLPVTGKRLYAVIFNERVGNKEEGQDNSFQVTKIKKIPLEKKMDVTDFNEPNLKSFVNFCTRFCFNAGDLSSGLYKSSDGQFSIDYVPNIIGNNNRELNTPARVNIETGVIQVSQSKFKPMTVPMRMAILLHEFSHMHLNDKMDSEIEADLNALLIYLGLGYPRIEAYEAFLKTFANAATQQNKARYDKINAFIENFEKHNFIVKE